MIEEMTSYAGRFWDVDAETVCAPTLLAQRIASTQATAGKPISMSDFHKANLSK